MYIYMCGYVKKKCIHEEICMEFFYILVFIIYAWHMDICENFKFEYAFLSMCECQYLHEYLLMA
jgi:hypothetical protein